jgi:hypothetical protein
LSATQSSSRWSLSAILRRFQKCLAATDLDSSERIVLGAEGWDDVPISSAVRASAALRVLYKPDILKGRELIDGRIASTTQPRHRGRGRRPVRSRGRPRWRRLPTSAPTTGA